jgi:hypothetical protein
MEKRAMASRRRWNPPYVCAGAKTAMMRRMQQAGGGMGQRWCWKVRWVCRIEACAGTALARDAEMALGAAGLR